VQIVATASGDEVVDQGLGFNTYTEYEYIDCYFTPDSTNLPPGSDGLELFQSSITNDYITQYVQGVIPSVVSSSLGGIESSTPFGCFSNNSRNADFYQIGKDALAVALPENEKLSVQNTYMAAGDGDKTLYFPIRDSSNPGQDAVMVVEDAIAIGFFRLVTGRGRYYDIIRARRFLQARTLFLNSVVNRTRWKWIRALPHRS